MKAIIPISLKRLAVRRMQDVQDGHLDKEQAGRMLKRQINKSRYSREKINQLLSRNYDAEIAEAFQFFRLL